MREVTYHRVTSHINIDSSVLQRKSNALHIDICNPLLSLCMCYLYVTQHKYRDGNVLHMLHRDRIAISMYSLYMFLEIGMCYAHI